MAAEDNNFDELRKLLALKRHEQPPPGFYDDLPGKVMQRIYAGDTAEDMPWLVRWFQSRLVRNAFVSSLGAATAGLMIYGVLSSQNAPGPAQPGLEAGAAMLNGQPVAVGSQARPTFYNPFGRDANEPASSKPVMAMVTNEAPSLFGPLPFQPVKVERTSYTN